MHPTNKAHTLHSREDVAATVAALTRSGARAFVLWEQTGDRTHAYLYSLTLDGTRTRVACIDDATDSERALGKDRATWAAVEAGAEFQIATQPRRLTTRPRPVFASRRVALA